MLVRIGSLEDVCAPSAEGRVCAKAKAVQDIMEHY